MIGARVVHGIGGGGLIALAFTVIADSIPAREVGKYQGYISAVYAVSSVAGLVSRLFCRSPQLALGVWH